MSVTSFADLITQYTAGERDFRDSKLDGETGDLRGLYLPDADFRGSFVVADFRSAILTNARFQNANIKTCDFRNANLQNADFRNSAIDAMQFENANLEGCRFAGAGSRSRILKEDELPDCKETWAIQPFDTFVAQSRAKDGESGTENKRNGGVAYSSTFPESSSTNSTATNGPKSWCD